MSPDALKKKCHNFLSTLISLDEETKKTASDLKKVIQNLIDGTIEAEEFSAHFHTDLKSNHQPFLNHYLKKSLPHLRQALISGELSIEGIRPPLPFFMRPAEPMPIVPSPRPISMSPDKLKKKCRKFLISLIDGVDETTKSGSNIRKFIQNLIDGIIEPEEFTALLQKELQTNHQANFIRFFKKSLPHFRLALISGEMTLSGIQPPHSFSMQSAVVPTTQETTPLPELISVEVVTPPIKKRKAEDDLLQSDAKSETGIVKNTELDHFAAYVVAEMKILNENQCNIVKKRIVSLLLDARCGKLME